MQGIELRNRKSLMKIAEREAGTSYEQGWKTYAYAAPFTKQGILATEEIVAQ